MTRLRGFAVSCLALALLGGAEASADELRFANVFGDHAVLQRDAPIMVWGMASATQALTVSLNGHVVHGAAGADGKWRVQLPKMPAGGPYSLSVTAAGKSVSVADVMIGDVYLCAGQSNMEFAVRASTNAWSNIGAASNGQLRFLNVPAASEFAPRDELKQPAEWKVAAPDTIGAASAVCYYMARSLQTSYKIPVGFINASWGGTTIEGWISPHALRTVASLKSGVDAVGQRATDPAGALRREEERQEAWWDAHDPAAKAQRAWIAPDFDDSSWRQITPSGSWRTSGIDDFTHFGGVAWFRTAVVLTEAQARDANALMLGPVDSFDNTWVNGVRVGGGSTGWVWRDYPLPKGLLKAGRNVIAMRVLGSEQGGGLTGQPGTRGLKTIDGQVIPLPPVWKYQIGSALKGLSVAPAPWDIPTSLTTLYNGMIAPLAGFKFRLAAWYQGESNALAADQYGTLLPLMMNDWRGRFGQRDLPFLIVQLTSYGAVAKRPTQSAWAELREAQAATVRNDPHAALVVTIDYGDRSDIHPTQKTIVGERLARAARAVAYGEALSAGGPEAMSARRAGADILIDFRHANGGLVSYSSDKAIGFEACAGTACTFADATIAGTAIRLAGANKPGVTRVRYAWADAPFVNLFGADDLPVAPFQLDVK